MLFPSEELPPAGGESSPYPRRGGKRVDTYGFYPLDSRFPLFLNLAQTRARRPLRNGERQRSFSTVGRTVCAHFSTYTQCQIPFCYTYRLLHAGATYPCRATRLSGYYGRHLRISFVHVIHSYIWWAKTNRKTKKWRTKPFHSPFSITYRSTTGISDSSFSSRCFR